MRQLFEFYAQHGKLSIVARDAAQAGLRSKRRVFASGRTQGGAELTRGQIHHILTNPIYLGKIRHKQQIYEGLHAAIVAQDLWDEVQVQLSQGSHRARHRTQTSSGAPSGPASLQGKLKDETGDRLTPTHTTRRGKRLRYYVSHRLIAKGSDPSGWRLPAAELETLVAKAVADHLTTQAERHALANAGSIHDGAAVQARAMQLATRLTDKHGSDLSGPDLRAIVASGTLKQGHLRLTLDRTNLALHIGVDPDRLTNGALDIKTPFSLRRRGVEAKLVTGPVAPAPDRTMIRALAQAHRWIAQLKAGTALAQIAADAGTSEAQVRIRSRLAFLAPRIQQAILDGTQPPELTLERLVRHPMPLDWTEQEKAFLSR